MNLHLEVDKEIKILVNFIGIFDYKLGKRLTGNIIGNDSPFAVNLGNFMNFVHFNTGFLNSSLVKSFVKNVGL